MFKRGLCCILAALSVAFCFYGSVLAVEIEVEPSEFAWSVLYSVNNERLEHGLEPLSAFNKLNYAARIRVGELIEKYQILRPDDSVYITLLDSLEIPYNQIDGIDNAAQLIARGYSTPGTFVNSQLSNQDSRMALLSSDLVHMGVSYAYEESGLYNHFWSGLLVGDECTMSDMRIEKVAETKFSVGTTLDEIADSMTFRIIITCDKHGETVLPLSAALCYDYDDAKLGLQTISVRCYGIAATLIIELIEGQQFIPGDANMDGSVNTGDAAAILLYLIGAMDAKSINLLMADFNYDGKVNTGDASAILNYLLGA